MNALYLGIDAGNSKTAALVSDATGTIAGAGRSGCGDIYGAVSPEAAVAEVLAAIDAALAQAGASRADVAWAAFRLAGVDWQEDRTYWEKALAGRFPSRSIRNDGYAAIRCGEPSGVGVAVAAGTAAAIAARGPDGTLWDMGWWGQHAMGALGLAIEAFRAVNLAELGLGRETALTTALPAHYDLSSVAELNHWFTRREGAATQTQKAGCARVVTAAATAGDPVAVEIVQAQGRHLATYAGVAARRTGLTAAGGPVSVVLSGSVLMADASPVAEAMLAELPARIPGAVPHRSTLPPVAGATLDALDEGGISLTEAVLDRLAGTLPPKTFLET
ncbi:BadF/BadG/BcrA/BcrD ATPase family protein [Nonomuraea purpurea]|uniref:BadF/BadG/BcrA/BcrD ATPase family protein n=1 Tax=Nonomuraea purpurea TaxID=1849276 RepID=A0ABV8GJW2_9ACTN